MSRADDIVERCAALVEAGSYFKTVARGFRKFNPDELPAACVFCGDATAERQSGDKISFDVAITIHGYRGYTDHPGDEIKALIGVIRGALEVDDTTLAGLLRGNNDRLTLGVHGPVYPESAGSVAGAKVIYSAPHISTFGGAA